MKKCLVIYDCMALLAVFFDATFGIIYVDEIITVYTVIVGLCFLAIMPWWIILMSDLNKLL